MTLRLILDTEEPRGDRPSRRDLWGSLTTAERGSGNVDMNSSASSRYSSLVVTGASAPYQVLQYEAYVHDGGKLRQPDTESAAWLRALL